MSLHLPVTSSIISTTALQIHLQQKYRFSQAIQVQLLKAGINHSYLLTDGSKKYMFRIYTYNWRSSTEIHSELLLLEKLRAEQLPVSFPLKTQQDNYIVDIPAPEGLRFGVLFSYAAGEKQQVYAEDLHLKIGKLMARFHQVTAGDQMDRITYTAQNILVDSLSKIQTFLPKGTIEMNWLVKTQKELLTLWSGVDLGQIRQGTVHLDIWFDNLNITSEGEVTLFDFDFCGNSWQCLDVAYYLLQLYNIEKEETIRQVKVDAFLKGYESVQQLSTEERRLLPMLGLSLYYFYLGVQCERHADWSNVFLNEAYLKAYINKLVKGYYSNHF